jgi:hypothetical protein
MCEAVETTILNAYELTSPSPKQDNARLRLLASTDIIKQWTFTLATWG